MKTLNLFTMVLALALVLTNCGSASLDDTTGGLEGKLPEPIPKGKMSLEETLSLRESIRQFEDKPLTVEQVSQLLWSAQGVTHSWGDRFFRTAPSAGATYPLETYILTVGGGYKYNPNEHSLTKLYNDDLRGELSEASLGQTSVRDAHAVIIFTMIEQRTSQRYGERAFRYICMEAGHAAQNIHLMAVSLGLGSVPIGAFEDERVANILELSDNEQPLYIIPVGYILE